MEQASPLASTTSDHSQRFLRLVTLAALPSLLVGLYRFGPRVLVMFLLACLVGAAVEYGVDALRRNHTPKTFLPTALLFVLLLPPAVPLWMVAAGIAFALLIAKEVFGGTGCQLVSPPLLGLTFLMLSYPAVMTSAYLDPAAVNWIRVTLPASPASPVQTPVMLARQGQPTQLSALLLGPTAGPIGQTAALAVLIGGLFLLVMRAIDWRIVAGTLAAFLLLEILLRPFPGSPGLPVGWHLLTGPLLLVTFFLATDPVTSPATRLGRLLFGILIGAAAMLLRRFSVTPDDAGVAVLVANLLTPLLSKLDRKGRGGP